MRMVTIDDFAHGYHYGDYSGVVFYGPPSDGLWLDRLAVSSCYIGPLFRAVLDRSWRNSGGERVPRLASEWNTLDGWSACAAGPVPVSPKDAEALAAALCELTPDDLAPNCAGSTPDECMRSAAVIIEFLRSRLARDAKVCIEQE
jgi:hypothetical protein